MERHQMVTVWRAVLVTEQGGSYVAVVLGENADQAGDEAENQTGDECVMVETIGKVKAA